MLNLDNIGKRIRMLRKKKGLSQERLAEDLRMYQADISNLERAISGSGISDLIKLDGIADYFGVTLGELLTGFKEESETTSDTKKSEGLGMKDYKISKLQYFSEEDIFFSEVTLVSPDQQIMYIAFLELDGAPGVYKSKSSFFEKMISDIREPELEKELEKSCFLMGEDYIDIFSHVTPEWVDICRLLIFIATEDEVSVKKIVAEAEGKLLGDIEIPLPSREPEDLFYVDYSDLSTVYRFRLMVESSLQNPSVYSDLEDTEKREEAILEKLKAACVSEEAYKVWKKDLIDAKIKEVIEKQHIVVCTYAFAGMGQYQAIMPEDMIDSFLCWINGNGSAFYGGSRDATESEIRSYVSQHIADELLGIKSPLP